MGGGFTKGRLTAGLGQFLLLGLLVAETAGAQGPMRPPLRGAAPAEQAEREVVRADLEWVAPDVLDAMLVPLELQLEVARLTAPIDAEGNPITDEKAYFDHLYGPEAPFRTFVVERSEWIDFEGRKLPSGQFFIECLAHDAGYRAMRDLLAGRPELEPGELLDLLTPRFLGSRSMVAGPESTAYFDRDGQGGGIVPLSNAGALGYLLWGLLQQEEYWEPEERDRESFILALLSRGFESKLNSQLVERALMAPLRLPSAEDREDHPGRGIAGSLDALRGKVGYTRSHEIFLAQDLALMQDLVEASATSTPAEPLELRTSYFEQWTAHMLDKVREELYGTTAADKMRRGPNTAERQAYWLKLFKEVRYDVARELALAEVRAIMANLDEHPATPRIEELEALGETLTEAEELELKQLLSQREEDQSSMLTTLCSQLGHAGAVSHYDLTLTTLLTDLPAALSGGGERFVGLAWNGMTLADQPRQLETLREHLAGLRELPDAGVESMILSSGMRNYPGTASVLGELVHGDSLRLASSAISSSDWMDDKAYEDGFGSILERSSDPTLTLYQRSQAFNGLVWSVMGRPKPEQKKAYLLRTMEGGRWIDPEAPGYFGASPDLGIKLVLKEVFSAKELASLVAEGKLLSSLFE